MTSAAHELLLEIGCEELPAGALAQAQVHLKDLLAERLHGARLTFERVETLGSPRRLAARVVALAEKQEDVSELVVGPPVRAAFGADGEPTRAAVAFAGKHGVAVTALERTRTEKGEYVALHREEKGAFARTLLPGVLGAVIRALPWKKSMRWGARDETFARPVRWLVAVYGGDVVPVELAGLRAGRETRGHRFLAPAPLPVDGFDGWIAALRKAFVLVDPSERRSRIEAELARIAREAGVTVRPDEALLVEVTNLVEYPVGVLGSFDEAFLAVPEAVIVSAMRAHQRYFALEKEGRLVPRFVTIAGTVVADPAEVRRGNERVLRARLADARFFFDEDRKVPLTKWGEKLGGVVFQEKLGTIAQKSERIERLAAALAGDFGVRAEEATRAARLLKADLATHMVGEFPDLQGVMGEAYARLEGERDEIARAIREHYLPRGAGDALPASPLGALCAAADRLDTLVGCFGVGLAPTGSADPFALRRAAIGLLAIWLQRGLDLELFAAIDMARAGYDAQGKRLAPSLPGELGEFLRVRERGLLAETLPQDVVDAAQAAAFGEGWRRPVRTRARAQALVELARTADFAPLGVAFKRVANILKGEKVEGGPDPALFEEDAERALHRQLEAVHAEAERQTEAQDYAGALRALARLKPAVDLFFDKVLVMAEDARLRQNRLRLLGALNALFAGVADFRQLAV